MGRVGTIKTEREGGEADPGEDPVGEQTPVGGKVPPPSATAIQLLACVGEDLATVNIGHNLLRDPETLQTLLEWACEYEIGIVALQNVCSTGIEESLVVDR